MGGPKKISSSVQELVDLESKEKLDSTETLKNFAEKLKVLRNDLKEIFKKIKKDGKTIAGYGAARSGTTLITQMNLGKLIDYIVDDSPQKQGKYTPGDHILVKPTNTIYEKRPDYIFILAWIHAKNIIKNNKKFLDQGGFFITCSPEIKIIGKQD
jgi:hypothetical protein